MVQLMFNDNFDNLMDEPIKYWKTVDDLPRNIKAFIAEKSNSIPIFD